MSENSVPQTTVRKHIFAAHMSVVDIRPKRPRFDEIVKAIPARSSDEAELVARSLARVDHLRVLRVRIVDEGPDKRVRG